ncbi:MAG: hypothetical protein HY913_07830 [Desulfomonile tiedjei]|nr:hypothetical protein [Desulfomonile tiedjei]
MSNTEYKPPRWETYVYYEHDPCKKFWKDYLSGERNVLMIVGMGFDPRMCTGPEMILSAGGQGKRKCLLIRYIEGEDSISRKHDDDVRHNRERLNRLVSDPHDIEERSFDVWNQEDRWVGSRRAANQIDETILSQFTDIIVDISAMPRGIYSPIITKILWFIDRRKNQHLRSANLHILVSEDVELDIQIQEEPAGLQAVYLMGFSSDFDQQADADRPKVWIPILGEGKREQLEKIYRFVAPDEVCPVLPSPSVNPRRADNLVGEHRELLFQTFRVEPSNIIYACEWNPFEVYRQIRRTIVQYDKALERLGGCKAAVSATSSKLLSIGALLAAYECKFDLDYRVGIATVEAHGYSKNKKESGLANQDRLHTLWLSGEFEDV